MQGVQTVKRATEVSHSCFETEVLVVQLKNECPSKIYFFLQEHHGEYLNHHCT